MKMNEGYDFGRGQQMHNEMKAQTEASRGAGGVIAQPPGANPIFNMVGTTATNKQFRNGDPLVNGNGQLRQPYRNMPGQGGMGGMEQTGALGPAAFFPSMQNTMRQFQGGGGMGGMGGGNPYSNNTPMRPVYMNEMGDGSLFNPYQFQGGGGMGGMGGGNSYSNMMRQFQGGGGMGGMGNPYSNMMRQFQGGGGMGGMGNPYSNMMNQFQGMGGMGGGGGFNGMNPFMRQMMGGMGGGMNPFMNARNQMAQNPGPAVGFGSFNPYGQY